MPITLSESIGGYLAFEKVKNRNEFSDFTLLNSARNCLIYYIEHTNIRKISVPYYTCPAVWEVLRDCGCEIYPYDIDNNFLPIRPNLDVPIIYTNYFGICERQVRIITESSDQVIVDNAQALYAKPSGMACIYSPRKFLPLPDGGLLWPRLNIDTALEYDESWDRCGHLLKRPDLGAEIAYREYCNNEAYIDTQPVKKMSHLTECLFYGYDCVESAEIRRQNFMYLHETLKNNNELQITLTENDVPLAYPFYSRIPGLRERLIEHKIYVPRYWPASENNECMSTDKACRMADNILPLPLDQRYGYEHMKHILQILNG